MNGETKDFPLPLNQRLGLPEFRGIRQLWGRTLMHLIGHSLGLSDATVGNMPIVPGRFIDGDNTRDPIPPESYAAWDSIQYAPPSDDGTPSPIEAFPDPLPVIGPQDADDDGIADSVDNCPQTANHNQADLDHDKTGDVCDPDRDGDGWPNFLDSTPGTSSSASQNVMTNSMVAQETTASNNMTGYDPFPDDTDNDGIDNATDTDDDADSVTDTGDNCDLIANTDQADTDSDQIGNACDADDDNDTLLDQIEIHTGSNPLNAASTPEFLGNGVTCTDGVDNDLDGQLDASDQGCIDTDGDTSPNFVDNCPSVSNHGWWDRDEDGSGDACDPTPLPPNDPPTVSAGGPYTVNEGGAVTLVASGSDPELGALDYVWDLDGDGVFGLPGQEVTFSAAGIQGPQTITIAV